MNTYDPLNPYVPGSKTRSYKERTKMASSPLISRPGFTQTGTDYRPNFAGERKGNEPLGKPGTETGITRPAINNSEKWSPFSGDFTTNSAIPRPDYADFSQNTPSASDCNCHPAQEGQFRNPSLDNIGNVTNVSSVIKPGWHAGLALDLPPTAGAGKYSRQSILSMAMNNSMVQSALAAGQKVMLIRSNRINGKQVNSTELLGNGSATGSPFIVSFTGDLNSDGSQAKGRQASFAFPNGTTVTPFVLLPNHSNSAGTGCGCNDNNKSHSNLSKNAVNNTCHATSTRQLVTDVTHSTGTVGREQSCPEPSELIESYFFVTDKEGNDTHHASRTFFRLMNACAGDLFVLNHQNGMVKLRPGKKMEDIDKIESSARQSKILAKTIYDAIQGGDSFNGSAEKQIVRMRVLRQNDEEVDNFSLDDFNSGFVDLDDYQDTMKESMPDEQKTSVDVGPVFVDGTGLPNTIIAPAIIGQAIRERFAMEKYEQYVARRRKISKEEYESTFRQLGAVRASEILREMVAGVDPTFKKVFEKCQYIDYENQGIRMQYYPAEANWELAIVLYSSTTPKDWFRINGGYLRKKN